VIHSHPSLRSPDLSFQFPIYDKLDKRVRVILHAGLGWFYAEDVGHCLLMPPYHNVGSGVVSLLDSSEFRHDFPTANDEGTGAIHRTLINEYGMMHATYLIGDERSENFRQWLISKPLPEIRRAICLMPYQCTPSTPVSALAEKLGRAAIDIREVIEGIRVLSTPA
jgi:prophage antirepressor-like protein